MHRLPRSNVATARVLEAFKPYPKLAGRIWEGFKEVGTCVYVMGKKAAVRTPSNFKPKMWMMLARLIIA